MILYMAGGSFIFRGPMLVTILSLVLGLVFFRIFSPFPSLKETKAREDDLFTITLSLIITLWIGKIITNFPLFIKNPQAGLVYPAGKYALYAGLVMTGIYIVWHYSRKGESRPWPDILLSSLMVIISGQFLFGFFNFVLGMQSVNIAYLIFYAILLIIMIFAKGRVDRTFFAFGLLAAFAVGQIILGFFWRGYLFQFYPGLIFWIILLLFGLYGLSVKKRKVH